MPPKRPPGVRIYQFKVTLRGVRPPIWRRFQVRSNTTLPKLHQILQVVMGWGDYHLHEFDLGEIRYGIVDPEFDDLGAEDERKVKLSHITKREGTKFIYLYDFGDGWEHQLLIEKILDPEPKVRYPICLAGERHCPPEDCGGAWGYEEFLAAIRNPEHPDHADYLKWAGGSFDAEAFDPEAVNLMLKQVR